MLERPSLSLALAAFRRADSAPHPRQLLESAAAAGFRWVTLDAAMPGIRPRDLDRSARRDLAALLRRLELGLMGVDLWIPPAHFATPDRVDRAIEVSVSAVELAADLVSLSGGSSVVSLTLPADRDDAAAAIGMLSGKADARDVVLADHTWPPAEPERASSVRVGLDPAAVLLAGGNPAKAAAGLGSRLAVARLSDASDVTRIVPGGRDGRLNDLAYVVALDTAGYGLPIVLDARGLPEPGRAAVDALSWWTNA